MASAERLTSPPARSRSWIGFSFALTLNVEASFPAAVRAMLVELQHALVQGLPGEMFYHEACRSLSARHLA